MYVGRLFATASSAILHCLSAMKQHCNTSQIYTLNKPSVSESNDVIKELYIYKEASPLIYLGKLGEL